MITKICTDIDQSKKLAEILPIGSNDMYYEPSAGFNTHPSEVRIGDIKYAHPLSIPCWSLAALFNVLPEINGVNLKFERVKAEDGYNGYYYHIEYEGIILIPYSKNLVDACYEMILKLHEQKLL